MAPPMKCRRPPWDERFSWMTSCITPEVFEMALWRLRRETAPKGMPMSGFDRGPDGWITRGQIKKWVHRYKKLWRLNNPGP